MLALLRHMLDASYLYALQQEPLGAWPFGALWWALALAVILGFLARHRVATTSHNLTADLPGMLCSALGLTWMALRPWLTGPLSARIWPFTLSTLALAATLMTVAGPHKTFRPAGPCWRALGLCLQPHDPGLPRLTAVCHLAAHGVGLAWLTQQAPTSAWPCLLAPMALGTTWLVQVLVGRRRHTPLRVELLAPLYLAYLAKGMSWLVGTALGVNSAAYAAFQYPDLWSPWFDSENIAQFTGTWLVLATVSYLGLLLQERWPLCRGRALALLAPGTALIWYLLVVVRHLSVGVTGSDPYCYLQMACDLVRTGSALHAFPLVEAARQANLPVWPTVHVGYNAPAAGVLAATVWPTGWPLMLTPLIWLGGEPFALWGAPLCLLASALLVWRLPKHLWPGQDTRLVGGLAAAITLTSLESTLRSLVPMADAAAQLCSVAMLYALARGQRSKNLGWDLLAGLALGLAYWVRHPLLWLGVGAIAWYTPRLKTRQGRYCALVMGLAALLTALPDLIYHAQHLGAFWRTESPEWFLISAANVPPTLAAMLRDGLLRRSELGYLWPAIALGLGAHARDRQQHTTFWLMLLSLLATLAFALCYSALRWRDLIALLPFFALWAALGLVTLWRQASARETRLRAATLGAVLLLLATRATTVAQLPWAAQVWTFGHVSPVERAALDALAARLPDGAIVATGLSSGAVERYTGHRTVRPSSWTKEQFRSFCQAAESKGRDLYLLEDGEEMALWLAQQALSLDLLCSLDLPTMGLGGQAWPHPAALYQLAHPNP